MKTMRLYCLFFIFLLCLTVSAIAGNKPVSGPVPAWLEPLPQPSDRKPDEREIGNGIYMKLIEEQTNVETQEKYEHWIKQIVSESGVQDNAQLSVAFAPDFEQLTFHKILVRRDGKEINKLDLAKIRVIQPEAGLDNNIYTGVYNALLILDDIRKGDQVEVAYTIKGANPIFRNKFDDIIALISYAPVVSFSKIVLAAASRPVHFKYYNNAPQVTATTRGGLKVYAWKNISVPAYKRTGNPPAWYTDCPYAEMSEFAGWAELAQWGVDLVNNYNYPLPAGLQELVAQWSARADGDPLVFATLATRFVQDEVRYQGMEIGEYTHRPYTPAEVFAHRYGDCKDKALLLVMILRSQHINAWVTFVNTTSRAHVTDRLPGISLFNHAIVKAELDNRSLFIDATISQQRGSIAHNYIPDYGAGLVAAPGVTKPELIPFIQPAYPGLVLRERFYINRDSSKPVTLMVSSHYDHGSADYFRALTASGSRQDLEKRYEEYYNKFYPGTTLRDTIAIADNARENEINTKETYTLGKLWQQDPANPGTVTAGFYARAIYDRLADPANAPEGKPFALALSCNVQQVIEIITPEPWTITDQRFKISREDYDFEFIPRRVNDTHVELIYNLVLRKDYIPAEKLAQYRVDYKQILNSLSYYFTANGQGNSSVAAGTGAGTGSRNDGGVNMLALVLVVLTLSAASWFVWAMNRKSGTHTLHQWETPEIGGWLVFLGIALFGTLGRFLYFMYANYPPYFSNAFWSVTNVYGPGFQLEIMMELVFPVFAAVLCVALIYWFFKKRDIFPRMFMVLLICNLAFALLQFSYLQLAPQALKTAMAAAGGSTIYNLLAAILYTLLWGLPIYHSPRVQYTFVRPHTYDEDQDPDVLMYRNRQPETFNE